MWLCREWVQGTRGFRIVFLRRRMALLCCGRLPLRRSNLMLGSFFVLAQELYDGFLEVAAQLRPNTGEGSVPRL